LNESHDPLRTVVPHSLSCYLAVINGRYEKRYQDISFLRQFDSFTITVIRF